jgi:thymidine phosphorylase
MVALVGLDGTDPAAVLARGDALAVWRAMVEVQGGDPEAELSRAPERHEVTSPLTGYVIRLEALAVGTAAWRLGAGRAQKEHPVSPSAGVVCVAREGEPVEAGQPILELHVDDPARLPGALAALEGAIEVGPEPPQPQAIVIDTIRA